VKERFRMLLACTGLDTAAACSASPSWAADLPEAGRLWETINDWWDEIETFNETWVTNAPYRGREHRDQAHQAHRTRLPQPPALLGPYPATQPPADTSAAHA
jgi:hypothetical protein